MKCHNQLCIYQEDGHCMLEEIELNAWGCCTNSIATIVVDPSLKQRKKVARERIELHAAIPYTMEPPPSK